MCKIRLNVYLMKIQLPKPTDVKQETTTSIFLNPDSSYGWESWIAVDR